MNRHLAGGNQDHPPFAVHGHRTGIRSPTTWPAFLNITCHPRGWCSSPRGRVSAWHDAEIRQSGALSSGALGARMRGSCTAICALPLSFRHVVTEMGAVALSHARHGPFPAARAPSRSAPVAKGPPGVKRDRMRHRQPAPSQQPAESGQMPVFQIHVVARAPWRWTSPRPMAGATVGRNHRG